MISSLYGEEHRALAASARRFVEDRIVPWAAQWDDEGVCPSQVRAEAGRLGYLSAGAQDPIGGVSVAWELGRCGSAGIADALLATAAAIRLLGSGGPPERALAEAAAAGQETVALAVWEPGMRDLAAPATAALPAEGTVLLAGAKVGVVDGARATTAVVLAKVPAGAGGVAGAFLAGTEHAGWRTRPAPSMGRAAAGRVAVDLEKLPARDAGLSLPAIRQAVGRWWLEQAAAAVAGAEQTWERGVAFARGREVFGRPVSRFQVNRHALARARTALTAARELVADATRQVVAAPAEAVPPIVAAREYAERAARTVSDLCLQLHGGSGYTREYEISRAWRDDRALGLDGGGPVRWTLLEREMIR